MNATLRGSIVAALAASVVIPVTASATNGYFAHGWGTQSKAMAGVATALPQDTLVTATNPAGMAFVGTSLDIGVAFFNPSDRGYEANDDFSSVPFITPGRYDSDGDWFLIPSFGYNHEIDSRSTIGISLYGNGGLNTDYEDRAVWENFAYPANTTVDNEGNPIGNDPTCSAPNNVNPCGVLSATTPTGVNLEQLFIEFPYTYKIGDGKQSVGVAPVFAVQRFEAEGLEPFRAASLYPDEVTNNGEDWSYGAGLHFGWYGQITDQLSAGLSYRSKMYMTELEDYKGLFANGGEFDIPAMFNVGVAYKAKPNLTLAFDYQHIFYDEIDAIANSNDNDITPCFSETPKPAYCLGGDDGLGFGWDSMDVFKLGLRYDHNDRLSFLGGVSYNTEFSSGRQALFNILSPATIRWHFTLGASYRHSASDAFNISLAYMPEEEISGTSASITQAQTGSIYMEQKEIEISWSHRF